MGLEAKRRLKLRNLSNDQLIQLYDSELILRLHNAKNLSDTRKILKLFINHLGNYPPSAELAKSFLSHYATKQPRTLYRYAQMIKAFMKWYGDQINDLKIKIPKSIPQYTENEAINKVREALGNIKSHKAIINRDLLLFDLDHQSGLRRSELSNLLLKHIHVDFLEVRKGKGEKDRIVPLTSSMALRLQNFIKDYKLNPDDHLFSLTPGSISNKIRQFADKAGVSDLHTHSLRHKFATNLLESGTNIRVVQDLMGHENLNTTQVYLSVTDKAKKEAINRLEQSTVSKSLEEELRNKKLETEGNVKHRFRKIPPEGRDIIGSKSPSMVKQMHYNSSDVIEMTQAVEINPKNFPYAEKKIFNPVKGQDHAMLKTDTPFKYPFDIDLKDSNILIESLQIRSLDPEVPFKFILSEKDLHGSIEWEIQDLVRMRNPVTQAIYNYPSNNRIVPYINNEHQKKLCCGLIIYFNQRPYHFDLQADGLIRNVTRGGKTIQEYNSKAYDRAIRDDFRKPITYKITLRYLLNSHDIPEDKE